MNKFAKKEWDHLTKLVCLAQEENKGNTEATEQAIAEITKEHGLTPDKLKEIKDFLESEREKETTRRKKEAEDKALAERMATIVRTFALDTRDDLQSVREQKMKDFAKKHGITLAALKADVKASDRELASEGDHEDESSHQAKASKLKGQPVLSGTKEESREVAPGTDHWPRLAEDDKPPHICTDQFNGYLVAQHVGRDLLYVVRIGWYSWHETHWHLGEEFAYRKAHRLSRFVLSEAANTARRAAKEKDAAKRKELTAIAESLTGWAAKSEARDRIYSAMALARPMLAIEHYDLDRDPWILNCVNGTLDLRTGNLRPHRRDDFITRCIPVAYDAQATCPTWLKFLDRIFDKSKDLIHFIQKVIGYSLTGVTTEQCIFIPWGGGKNGKSTLLAVIQAMMGAYAQQAAPELLIATKHERHPTEIAELRSARMVVSAETGEGRWLNETRVKQMSGGDRMKGHFMRQDNIEFEPTHKVFLPTNHKPKIRGTDYAIWRRIRLIPFTVTITPEECDPNLVEKLKVELPGILTWAMQGCLDWQKEGLKPPKEVTEATEEYKAESDVLAAFLADRCVVDKNTRVKAAELYNAYRQWCEQNGERITETQTSFGRRMAERGIKKQKVAAGFVYIGIRPQADGYEEGAL